MQVSRLFTYCFDPNVGPFDRVFRIVSGLVLAAFPFFTSMALPVWLNVVLTAFGLAWFLTGAVSRCGMYYLLNLSTRKAE